MHALVLIAMPASAQINDAVGWLKLPGRVLQSGSSGMRSSGNGTVCEPDACLENGGYDYDCCGLEGTTGCSGDHVFSLTANNGCMWNAGTCCTPTSLGNCSMEFCSSPGIGDENDCWAGAAFEPCTCSTGSARMTGATLDYEGTTYHEYTCCPDGSGIDTQGEICGDYIRHWVVGVIFGAIVCIAICCGIGCCFVGCRPGGCCNRRTGHPVPPGGSNNNTMAASGGVAMTPFGLAPVAHAQPMAQSQSMPVAHAQPMPAQPMMQMQVTVPAGVMAGEPFLIGAPDGSSMQVVATGGAGTPMMVQMHAAAPPVAMAVAVAVEHPVVTATAVPASDYNVLKAAGRV